MRYTVWPGTRQELLDLLAAIQCHCTCIVDSHGVRRTSCPLHRMLVGDQRALNGLLFARRCLRDRVYMEEWRAGIGQIQEDRRIHSYYFTPTTRSAVSIDEFLAACRAEPMVATAHLRHGYFEPWLRDIGQPRLADLTLLLRGAKLDLFLLVAADGSSGR